MKILDYTPDKCGPGFVKMGGQEYIPSAWRMCELYQSQHHVYNILEPAPFQKPSHQWTSGL